MAQLTRLLAWSVEVTAGFDAAWAAIDGRRLSAEGFAVGQRPAAYSVEYRLETDDEFVTRRLVVEARTAASGTSRASTRTSCAAAVPGAITASAATSMSAPWPIQKPTKTARNS